MTTQSTLPVIQACPNPWCEALERDGDFSPEVRILSFGNIAVQCPSCQMSGPIGRDEAEAITAWNTRSIPDRNAVLEEAAAIVDQCNSEGPYNAIGAASRIRALKTTTPEPNNA